MYFAHIGNYMIYYLGFSADMMGYIEGVALVLAMLFTIPCTKLLNNNKAPLLCFISTVLNSLGVGLLGLFVRPENVNTNSIWNPMLLIGVLLLGMGYVLFLQSSTVWGKQLYPEDARGQFEGIRILFFVLIPMVVAPLIANPISFIMGAAAQLGIYLAYFFAIFMGFNGREAAAISIIGGADGPTSIFLLNKLGQQHLMGPIAVAAYSYMSLVPIIQPPVMKLLTTEKERKIKMEQLRSVSKLEKILFPIVITIVVCMILPSTAPLVGMLMLGNLFRECGVVKQLQETASNAMMYIVVILLGTSVGASTSAEAFLNVSTLKIVALGLIAFVFGTAGGVLLGKVLCKATHGRINPLIGSAGVSAVPMAARVSQKVGAEADPTNFLLMHAMGPNVAGVIGTAVAAGTFMAIFGV